MASEIGSAFGRVLESHRDVPNETAMTSIRDPSFAVLRLNEDVPFFSRFSTAVHAEVRARDPYPCGCIGEVLIL